MSEIKRVSDLDIGQDLEYQKHSWVIQRIGWTAMALVIFAGLLGVFGGGIASNTAVGEEDSPLKVEYDRFIRAQSHGELVMKLGAGVKSVKIDRKYLEAVQVESVSPAPETVKAAPEYEIYVFNRAADEPGKLLTVKFYVQPKSAQVISGQASAGAVTRDFRQYVYP